MDEKTLKLVTELVLINNEITSALAIRFKDLVEDVLPVLPNKGRATELLARLSNLESDARSAQEIRAKIRESLGC